MSVLRDDRPCGPYADMTFQSVEHPDFVECHADDCIHNAIDSWGWEIGPRTPPPRSDGLGYAGMDWPADYLFGFVNVAQLRHWFDGKLRRLDRLGFVIGVYEVPETHTKHGFSQSVFSYESAKRVDEVSVLKWKTLDTTAPVG